MLPSGQSTGTLSSPPAIPQAVARSLGTSSTTSSVGPNVRAAVHPPLGGARLEFERGYGYLQVYAPEDAGFACLEPMTAPRAALSDAVDLAEATPAAQFEASYILHAG